MGDMRTSPSNETKTVGFGVAQVMRGVSLAKKKKEDVCGLYLLLLFCAHSCKDPSLPYRDSLQALLSCAHLLTYKQSPTVPQLNLSISQLRIIS